MNPATPSRHERLLALLDRATSAASQARGIEAAEVAQALAWVKACANDLEASLRVVEREQTALGAAVERLEAETRRASR